MIKLLIGVLALLVLGYATTVSFNGSGITGSAVYNEKQASQLAVEHAQKSLPDYSVMVMKSYPANNGWNVEVKAVKNDLTCPLTLIRYYSIPPLDNYRDEKLVDNCTSLSNIIFEGEAILASQKIPVLKQAASRDAQAKAIKITQNNLQEKLSCTSCSYRDFLQQLMNEQPNLRNKTIWIVEWQFKDDNSKITVAMDELGDQLKIG